MSSGNEKNTVESKHVIELTNKTACLIPFNIYYVAIESHIATFQLPNSAKNDV